ncbi:MAG: hypothetical protein U0W40_16405 [Acidimicrobiia bacterium]
MSKFARRSMLVAVIAALGIPFAAASSSAQVDTIDTPFTLTVRKTVVGTGTGPSSVGIDCIGNATPAPAATPMFTLNFDAQGNPTTSTQIDQFFVIENGAWVGVSPSGLGGSCTVTEIATGGATSTSWTCAYDATEVVVPKAAFVPQGAGCEAASGSGTGPATIVVASNSVVSEQEATVVFTNTFVAAPPVVQAVVVQPAFTG